MLDPISRSGFSKSVITTTFEKPVVAPPVRLKVDSLDLAGNTTPSESGLRKLDSEYHRMHDGSLPENRERNRQRAGALFEGTTPAPLVEQHVQTITRGLRIPAIDEQSQDLVGRTSINLSGALLHERVPAKQAEAVSAVLRSKIDGSTPSDISLPHQEKVTNRLVDSAWNKVPGISRTEQVRISRAGLIRTSQPWSDKTQRIDARDSASTIVQNQALALQKGTVAESEQGPLASVLHETIPHLEGLPASQNGYRPYFDVANKLSNAAVHSRAPGVSTEDIMNYAQSEDLDPKQQMILKGLGLASSRMQQT